MITSLDQSKSHKEGEANFNSHRDRLWTCKFESQAQFLVSYSLHRYHSGVLRGIYSLHLLKFVVSLSISSYKNFICRHPILICARVRSLSSHQGKQKYFHYSSSIFSSLLKYNRSPQQLAPRRCAPSQVVKLLWTHLISDVKHKGSCVSYLCLNRVSNRAIAAWIGGSIQKGRINSCFLVIVI